MTTDKKSHSMPHAFGNDDPASLHDPHSQKVFAEHLQNMARRYPPQVVTGTQDVRALQARYGNQHRGWIVRTGNDYLAPQGGDVGYTPKLADAGVFETEEEAIEAGRDHCDPGFVVMRDPR